MFIPPFKHPHAPTISHKSSWDVFPSLIPYSRSANIEFNHFNTYYYKSLQLLSKTASTVVLTPGHGYPTSH